MSKRNKGYLVAAISLLILFSIYYVISIKYQNNINSMCGSGIIGMRHLAMYLIPILIVLMLFFIIVSRTKKEDKRCMFCNTRIESKFNACPYCGSFVDEE